MIDCIKQILKEDHWKRTEDKSEIKDQESGMKITLIQLPKNGLLITIPQVKAHIGIINNSKRGLTQSCYNLILIERDDCIDVYFIEMKKSLSPSGNKEKACNQILHTVPIWEYIVSMAKYHCKKEKKVNPPYFAIIAEKSSKNLDKQQVKSAPPNYFIHGGKRFRIIYSASTIPLKQLK